MDHRVVEVTDGRARSFSTIRISRDNGPRCCTPDIQVNRGSVTDAVETGSNGAGKSAARFGVSAHRPGQTLGQIVRSLDGISIQAWSSSAKRPGNGGSGS